MKKKNENDGMMFKTISFYVKRQEENRCVKAQIEEITKQKKKQKRKLENRTIYKYMVPVWLRNTKDDKPSLSGD